MTVTVTPATFTLVEFDHAALTDLASRLATDAGLPDDLDVVVDVVEATPAGSVSIESLDPFRVRVEGGAIEHPKRVRQLGAHRVVDVLGHQFLLGRDRLDPDFGAPSLDEPVTVAHLVAWDAYALGRLERLGHEAQPARRRYHFRNRHGFTDDADAAFDRLWNGRQLTWARITAISDAANLYLAAQS